MGFEADFEKWKQEHFGNYCMTKCDRTCCDMRNVSLSVNEKELMWIFGEKINPEIFKQMGVKTAGPKGMYSIETKDYCRKFDSRTCKCLDYNRRPLSCRDFPFLVERDAVVIKNGCPLDKGAPEYKKLAVIASMHGKVIVKRGGK